MSITTEEKPRKGYPSNLSKKKYHEIENAYRELFSEEDATKAMQVICNVLNFDPSIGLYPKARLKEVAEKRRIAAELKGVTVHEIVHGKKAYVKKGKPLKDESM